MKFFKDQANKVFAFESDGSQDDFIGAMLIAITEAEADDLRALPFEIEQTSLMMTFRSTREVIINRLMGIAARAQRAGDNELAGACDLASQELLDITRSPKTQAAVELRDAAALKAALMLQYRAVAASLPAACQSAFKELDL